MRLFAFLEAMRAVWQERACLTHEGSKYLGVDFRFPVHDELYEGQISTAFPPAWKRSA